MSNAQKRYRVIRNGVPEPFANRVGIQHRIAPGQHACAVAAEVPDKVPQCTPGAHVASTVRQLIEAINCHLNRTAPDQRLQLLFDEARAEARQRACNAVIQ